MVVLKMRKANRICCKTKYFLLRVWIGKQVCL